MANYDKDMAEERIQISDDKQKIYEDDRKKRDGMPMMGQATMGDRVSPLNYSGNNIKLKAPMRMDADLADMPLENIAGQGTNPTMMKKNISPMNRQEYGGNKGDDSMSDKDYSSPAKMYGGKTGDDSKSRTDY